MNDEHKCCANCVYGFIDGNGFMRCRIPALRETKSEQPDFVFPEDFCTRHAFEFAGNTAAECWIMKNTIARLRVELRDLRKLQTLEREKK